MKITLDMPVTTVWRMTLDDNSLVQTEDFLQWVLVNRELLNPKNPQWQQWRDEVYAGRPEDKATAKHRKRHGGKLE